MRTFLLILFITFPCPALATLPVEIEVAVEPGAPAGAMQQWAKALGECGLGRVRLRGITRSDEPDVKTREYGNTKRYLVVGILNSSDELIVPGGKFRSYQKTELQKFFNELPAEQEYNRDERGRFGLTEAQFRNVHAAFSKPVGAEILPAKAAFELLDSIASKLGIPVVLDEAVLLQLREASPPTVDLQKFTRGTALAILLRESHLAIIPEQPRGGELQLRIVPDVEDKEKETWPVGWKSDASPRTLAPVMYKATMIEINGHSLAEGVGALEKYIGIPIIYDRIVLERKQIDPDKIQVNIKRGKLLIVRAIDRMLSQARLSGELRVDEAGTPFYWVTQFGKNSPRATK